MADRDRLSGFVCSDCGAALRHGYTCDVCDGFSASTPEEYRRDKAGFGKASPQPAPHAMTPERMKEIASPFLAPDGEANESDMLAFGAALLAQPAAVEPAKPYGWSVRGLILNESPFLVFDEHIADGFRSSTNPRTNESAYEVFPVYKDAPSPAVAEPARKASDAQGAEGDHKVPTEMEIFVHWANQQTFNFKRSPDGGYYWDDLDAAFRAWKERGNRASPLPAATLGKAESKPLADCYSNDDGESWFDCPSDIEFVQGLRVGDEFELQASIRYWPERFRVIKAPDEESDDYEVEAIDAVMAAQQPAASDVREDNQP